MQTRNTAKPGAQLNRRSTKRLSNTSAALPWWTGYAVALLANAASGIILRAAEPSLPLYQFPIYYVPTTIITAYIFGLGPSAFSFFMSLILSAYFLIASRGAVYPLQMSPDMWAETVTFLLVSVAGCAAALLVRRQFRQIRNLARKLQTSNEALSREIAENKQAQAALRAAEAHRLEFYRRTIRAATGGKLIITDEADIGWKAGPFVKAWRIKDSSELSGIRHEIEELARAEDMDESRISVFCTSIGEAATNAIKHAPEGQASIHKTDDSLIFMVSDSGPGIAPLHLPDVALTDNYSTAGTLGMGYKVMISFCDRVYLATDSGGTTVAVEMKFHEPVSTLADIDLLGFDID